MSVIEDDEDEALEDQLFAFGPRGLAFSVLAIAPLFVAYELSLGVVGERSIAERLTTSALVVTGPAESFLRWGSLAAGLAWGAWRMREAEFERGRAALFLFLESAVFALLLGPLLALLLRWFPVDPSALRFGEEVARPSLEGVMHLVGCAAWEELLVRLGCFSALYFLTSRVVQFLGGPRGLAGFLADTVALTLSSIAFAALHLDEVASWIGSSGEAFDRDVFLWRTLAGLSLGAIYRFRGLGVAAWTHALYNVGFAVGASPAVFLLS